MSPAAPMQFMATELTERLGWAPAWAVSLSVIALSVVVALIAHATLVAVVRRTLRGRDHFWRELAVRTRKPAALALALAAIAATSPVAPLTAEAAGLLRHVLLIAVIGLVGWAAMTAMDIVVALYMRRYRVDVSDNLVARKHLTQVKILRRAGATLIVILTAAFALMTISGVRQWGVSLLAAGGAASIIVGLALQPLLSNLIAGIQIAMTQPIRIDDAIIIEGEFGRVEEINATYVVVRIWDDRRMVVPLTFFLQQPFQNWTRESASLTGVVMVYVDYAAPVDAIRAKLEELAAGSPLWDGRVAVMHVTELKERTMELRCLVSAANAGDAFDLRALVREKLVAFLQAEHPYALPRDRLVHYPPTEGERPEGGPSGSDRPQ